MEYEKATVDEVLRQLSTQKSGLSEEEATRRLQQYGLNEIRERKESPVLKFLRKFWAPVPWMLEVAVVLTFVLGKYLDMYIIAFLLVFNSVVGFIQENRAENAVEMLKSRLNVQSRVLRDGKWKLIPAKFLVPGDVVHVRMGDIVPADIKLFEGELSVDQSALTGESMPVERGVGSVLYSGSVIRRGEATGIVVLTGGRTYYGKTTELVSAARAESHLEKLILNIVKYLVVVDVALVVALGLFSVASKVSLSDVLPFALIVLIASVPAALPATFTIAMALETLELSKRGVLVTRLTAVEDAASMDVLNLDKTGTITENRMRVGDPVPLNGFQKDDVVRYAYMASDEASQDPIDNAVISCLSERGISMEGFERLNFKPFDPSTKRTEAQVRHQGRILRVLKGAPQVIASIAQVDDLESYNKTLEDLSSRGFRTISVAVGEEKLRVVGILPLYDRPRPDSRAFVEEIKSLGVKPKMVTGDNRLIAKEIAREVNIGQVICDIREVKEKGGSRIEECDVFSEVYPEDKYFIVKSLQEAGHYVGMTGDGVNDAPALKQAEVGIAVANATDVAKASASMVLTHEGLIDVVEAIKSGRRIYQRMLTYTMNKVIKTLQVVLFLTISFFAVRFFVTTPFDIVLLLFLNDFVTMSIATDNVRYSKSPERWNVRKLVTASLVLASLILIESFLVLWIGLRQGLSQGEIHTLVFDMLVMSGQFTVYVVRERRHMWSSLPSKFLLLASGLDLLFVILISWFGILVTPLPPLYIVEVLLITLVFSLVVDVIKNVTFKAVKI
nr:plasma-membrane proton-efflux P-type ATPase [Metallosphaera tengchongensis]